MDLPCMLSVYIWAAVAATKRIPNFALVRPGWAICHACDRRAATANDHRIIYNPYVLDNYSD